MKGERHSSRSSSWKEANPALLGVTNETIGSTSGESQCQTFCRSADGWIPDSASRKSVIESRNGLDGSSFGVHGAPALKLSQHRSHGQKLGNGFYKICLNYLDVPRLVDIALNVINEKLNDGVVLYTSLR